MTALAHETKKDESAARKIATAPTSPKPFEETETNETPLEYGPGTFNWPVRILWIGFVVLCVWYVAQYYVPSLLSWMPWKP